MAVKKIYLERRDPTADKYIGKFLEEDSYDLLVTEDCDVYAPLTGMETEHGDHNLLLSLRKNVFPMDLVHKTWENIRGAAVTSDNRGIGAGQIDAVNHPRAKLIYTNEHDRIVKAFMRADTSIYDETSDIVYDPKKREVTGTRFHKWIEYKMEAEGFVFPEWVEKVKKLPPSERASEALRVYNNLVSDTGYANPVFSGIAGFFDRYPRIPFCRQTAFTANNLEQFNGVIPFVELVSDQFKKTTPTRYQSQLSAAEGLDPRFRVGKSAYTTLTVNKNYRTAVHTDAGDLVEGFGNLTVVTGPNCPAWEGSYLVFPHYRVAVDVRPGDMLAMNVHEYHGNTAISGPEGIERISMVCYFREGMMECKDKDYEDLRHQFVNLCMKDPDLIKERSGKFNGVFEGMWQSEKWFDFLRAHGREDMVQVNVDHLSTDDIMEFFS